MSPQVFSLTDGWQQLWQSLSRKFVVVVMELWRCDCVCSDSVSYKECIVHWIKLLRTQTVTTDCDQHIHGSSSSFGGLGIWEIFGRVQKCVSFWCRTSCLWWAMKHLHFSCDSSVPTRNEVNAFTVFVFTEKPPIDLLANDWKWKGIQPVMWVCESMPVTL